MPGRCLEPGCRGISLRIPSDPAAFQLRLILLTVQCYTATLQYAQVPIIAGIVRPVCQHMPDWFLSWLLSPMSRMLRPLGDIHAAELGFECLFSESVGVVEVVPVTMEGPFRV